MNTIFQTIQLGELFAIKKIAILLQLLLGLFGLGLLVLTQPTKPVIATEPTPTVVIDSSLQETSLDGVCRLELGAKCDFPKRDDLAASRTIVTPSTNPVIGARGVPTYTLISVTFDRDMDFNTINNDTFQVHEGNRRLGGSIRSIEVSKMAVFYPDTPLGLNTTYTARVTTGVRDRSGESLAEDIVWSFTTTPGISPLRGDLSTFEDEISGAEMNIYFGDLHSHSGYSDGQGTPLDVFATARANGVDFFALTDHDIMLTDAEWQDMLEQADMATVDGAFVAIRGFEFTHAKGHLNVFDTETYIRGNDSGYADLEDFYTWLVDQPTAVAQFNHPFQDFVHDWNFNNFFHNPAVDQKILLRELSNAEQFFLSLDAGWHVGTLANTDTHQANWGCCPMMGLVAPALTKEAILDALRARRTFFVSPSDRNFALVLQANGYWMGSAIPNTATIDFLISGYDPDPKGLPLRLALYENGVRIANTTLSSTSIYRWTPTAVGRLGHYYYAEAYYDGWYHPAYSSPIWVEYPPVAKVGPPQMVAPNAAVTLDGRGSWDLDGDTLNYQWTQETGTPVALTGSNTHQASFIAPGTLGDLSFRLRIADTGSLSDQDGAVVTVTDRPILAIRISAPTAAEPGELITYTLTITNNGITEAVGVVITDAIPGGANYVRGGTPIAGDIVSWTVPGLAANGGVAKVSFVVTTNQGVINTDYRASCAGCVPAVGKVFVFTNANNIYLPVMFKVN